MDYIKYRKKASDDKERNINIADSILKKHLKKGDILVIKPNFSSIKIKLFNLPSYIISLYSRGSSHASVYHGNGKVIDLDYRLRKKHLLKMNLKDLLRAKHKMFKGFTVYAVQPKKYTNKDRYNVDRFFEELSEAGKEINLSIRQMALMAYWAVVKGISHKNIHKLKIEFNKKRAVCSTLIAHALKKNGLEIGRRPTVGFVPSTFIFSRNFKVKKKIRL